MIGPYAAEALVPTTLPRRFMAQLCKHFQHKLPVVLSEVDGRIDFPVGPCHLQAAASGLRMRVEAPDADGLARLEDVVARHLLRFAFREDLVVAWVAVAGASQQSLTQHQ
jgi:hypothetical protein